MVSLSVTPRSSEETIWTGPAAAGRTSPKASSSAPQSASTDAGPREARDLPDPGAGRQMDWAALQIEGKDRSPGDTSVNPDDTLAGRALPKAAAGPEAGSAAAHGKPPKSVGSADDLTGG